MGVPDDYDIHDEGSVLKRASMLTKKTLREMDGKFDLDLIGGKNTKGMFGQVVEEGYFLIDNNNRDEADFADLGIELKTHPIVRRDNGRMVAKERLVLGIINYMKADEEGFRTFMDKNSRLLLLFYRWVPDASIYDYRFLKVVDWVPSPAELQMIREDWEVIHRFIREGRAHLLSERYTKVLAANTKGQGGGRDLRAQPHSDIMAKQRSLSFKAGFMTVLFESNPDIGEKAVEVATKYEPMFKEPWEEGVAFEAAVLSRLDGYVGLSCYEIESRLGIRLNPDQKQYYRTLSNNMLGTSGGRDVKELLEAGITMKTVRIRLDGRPKESMSFPYLRYEEVAAEEWEDSDFHSQIDHRFMFMVFGFNTAKAKDEKDRKTLRFKGAFFWSMPDDDFVIAQEVWEDTRQKIIEERMDGFISRSANRLFHVRPHGRNARDTISYKGKEHLKRGFWFNDDYLNSIISDNLRG